MPRFGHDVQGTTGAYGIRSSAGGSVFTCPSSGRADSIGAWLRNWTYEPPMTIRGAIYRKSDLVLVGMTDEIPMEPYQDTGKLMTLPFSEPKPILAAGEEYILLVMSSYALDEFVELYYDVSNFGKGAHVSRELFTYPNFPIIATGITYDYGLYSIFCDYTEPITPTMGYLEAHIFFKGTEYVTTIKIDGGASHDVPTANPIALVPGNHTLYVPTYDITRAFAIIVGQTTIVNVYHVPTYNLSVGSTPQGISFNIVKK